jgi:2-enoate reductase
MKLLELGKIGKLTLRNRIIMAPMGNMLSDLDGRVSEREIAYYIARAKGGAGMITTAAARTRLVEQLSFSPLVTTMTLDAKIYGSRLGKLADDIHDYGAKVCLSITPGQGRNIGGETLKSSGAVAPSPLPAFADPNIIARELTVEEIHKIAQTFRLGAEVARDAGIDAIEVNAHAGYLIDEFMTPLWNKRADEYGGDLDNRLRFLMEIIETIRGGAGDDFPIIVKYGLTHCLEGGREVEEGLEIACRLEAAGIAALAIDAGCYETMFVMLPTTYQQHGFMADYAGMAKKVVNIPVIAVGRLEIPELAERVLEEGKADFIALGKGMLADPEWVSKVKEGRLEDVRPCLGDNEGCIGRIFTRRSVSCTVNAACGDERDLVITPAEKKKSVLVIGGGPAGMEAARVAALRGHKVTLCEKKYDLGGNLIPASVPDFKQDYKDFIEYLPTQIKKLGVEIKLATEATPQLVRDMKPDAVFIATGGTPIIPEIPGVGNERVATAIDVLLGSKEAGKSVVVIGGGAVGCEMALHLAQQGKQVAIVEILDTLACDMVSLNRRHLLRLLAEANVKTMTCTCVQDITDKSVVVADEAGKKSTLEADTIVIACGMEPDNTLYEALHGEVPEIYDIGDCVEPRNVFHAIKEGYRRARVV